MTICLTYVKSCLCSTKNALADDELIRLDDLGKNPSTAVKCFVLALSIIRRRLLLVCGIPLRHPQQPLSSMVETNVHTPSCILLPLSSIVVLGDPYSLRPRPTTTPVTLDGNGRPHCPLNQGPKVHPRKPKSKKKETPFSTSAPHDDLTITQARPSQVDP